MEGVNGTVDVAQALALLFSLGHQDAALALAAQLKETPLLPAKSHGGRCVPLSASVQAV